MKFARIITSVSCAVAGVLATGPALAERTYVAQPMPTAHYETPHPMAPALGQRAVVRLREHRRLFSTNHSPPSKHSCGI